MFPAAEMLPPGLMWSPVVRSACPSLSPVAITTAVVPTGQPFIKNKLLLTLLLEIRRSKVKALHLVLTFLLMETLTNHQVAQVSHGRRSHVL